MGRILWTGGEFSNGLPAPADRFSSWVPFSGTDDEDEKHVAHQASNGRRHEFRFRRDRGASFVIDKIPETRAHIALSMSEWLGAGGEVTVETGDRSARVYDGCILAPDADPPELELEDEREREYRMAVRLISLSGHVMLVSYDILITPEDLPPITIPWQPWYPFDPYVPAIP